MASVPMSGRSGTSPGGKTGAVGVCVTVSATGGVTIAGVSNTRAGGATGCCSAVRGPPVLAPDFAPVLGDGAAGRAAVGGGPFGAIAVFMGTLRATAFLAGLFFAAVDFAVDFGGVFAADFFTAVCGLGGTPRLADFFGAAFLAAPFLTGVLGGVPAFGRTVFFAAVF